MITQKEEKQIVYNGIANGIKSYFSINGNTLIIAVDAYDGPASIFTKMN